jgi:N-acyl-L-homoserine lactone synthetase
MKTVIIEPDDLDRVWGMKTLWFGMLKLRAMVFKDILKWDVHVNTAGLEYDRFDTSDDQPIYLVVKEGEDKVIGSMRFIPSTGKTMMSEVFRDTIPGEPIRDSHIWECSRVCWLPSTKMRQLQVSLKFIEGIREIAMRHDIHTLIGNFDDKMCALYSRAGFVFRKLGETTKFGPVVHLGRFDISPGVLDGVEATLKRYIEQLKDYQGAA